jgi:hypothetical protein
MIPEYCPQCSRGMQQEYRQGNNGMVPVRLWCPYCGYWEDE